MIEEQTVTSTINDALAELPELKDNELAKFPMTQYDKWIALDAQWDCQFAFLAADQDGGLKQNYVYGSGPKGKGYYHLLTKQAYKILCQKLIKLSATPNMLSIWATLSTKPKFTKHSPKIRVRLELAYDIVQKRSKQASPYEEPLTGSDNVMDNAMVPQAVMNAGKPRNGFVAGLPAVGL